MVEKNMVEDFFKSRKNANCILDLEKCLLSEDVSTIVSSMDTVQEIFSQIFEKGMLQESSSKDDNEIKFREWLLGRYNDFVSHLHIYLNHDIKEVQIKSLETLMKLIALESKYPLIKVEPDVWFFSTLLLQKIVTELLSDITDQHDLISQLKFYTAFEDVRFYTLKFLEKYLSQKVEVTDIFLYNCFYVLNSCSPTKNSSTFLAEEGVTKPFLLKKNTFSKTFSNVWICFLKYQLPIALLKKVLVVLPKRVLKHFHHPCLLTDFLTNLYNKGGLTSLLALSGLFELMQNYNVEYPDFYIKFYSLIDEKIINSKFHSTFFYLSNLFLSSTHLPAVMVAAFVKKLSRVSLQSNTESLVKLLPLIRNILIRHPVLHILLNQTEPKDIHEDPFDITATNPYESKAMKSSLWEIKDLKTHYNPAVSQKEKITNEIPQLEFNLADVLDASIDSIYRNDRKRKLPEPTTNEKPPKLKNCLDFF